jgi:hypothetical protein
LYLGAMIMGMCISIGCGYGSHTGIGVSTLLPNPQTLESAYVVIARSIQGAVNACQARRVPPA